MLDSKQFLERLASNAGSPGEWTADDLRWFSPSLRQRIEQVFLAGYRIAQEFVGTEHLQNVK
jgi:hypothetical protein